MDNLSNTVREKTYQNRGNPQVLNALGSGVNSVLDVGCGVGDNARLLAERGIVIDGITLSKEEAEQARTVCRNVWVHDLESGLPEEVGETYDAVICSHVLEHICWPEAVLAGIWRLLHPDGRLIVALPNILHVKNRLSIAFGRFEYTQSGLMDNTHFRFYTFRSASELLRCNKFDVLDAQAYGYLPLPRLRRCLPELSAKLDRLLCQKLPGLFGIQFVYVAQPSVK